MMKYNKYKSSGIEWLGDIPNDWEQKRVKDVFTQISQSGNDLPENGYVPLENIEQFTGKLIQRVSNKNNEKTNLFNAGDILINKLRPYLGKIFLPDFNGGVSGEVVVLRMLYQGNFNNSKYFFYRFLSTKFIFKINSMTDGVKMPRTNPSKILNLNIAVPPSQTQTQIAYYLDSKTQAIDKKINLLNQKVSYYKEYKKSLINETVCRGLDKSVNCKETELGFNVASNFSIFRLKNLGYLYSGLSGKAGDDFNQDESPNNKKFIPFTNIANNTYLKKDHLDTVVVYDNENQNSVKKEDIFFLMSSEGYEDIGKSAILDDDLNETYLNSFCKGYRVTSKKANPYFLNYLLLSDNYRKQLTVEGKGFTRINLKMEKVNDFIVFIPNTIDEQNKIVSFLDDKTQTIDKIVSNINTQIQTLKELRKTLINDAVTGKIKVN